MPPWQLELALGDKIVSNSAVDRSDYLPPMEHNYRLVEPHPALAVTTSQARLLVVSSKTE